MVLNTPGKPEPADIAQTMPPVIMPTNSDEYTSFVISARPIATMGGSSDHIVPTASVTGAWTKQHIT